MTAPVVVVGATGGIGEALARRLAAAGRPLHLVGRDAARLAPLAGALGASHAVADVLDHAALARAVQAGDSGAGLGGLAYAVGSIVIKSLRAATAADFMDAFQLNAVGAAVAVQAAQRGLAQAGGSIVLFSTVAARQGFANHAVIAAAKGAVEGIVLSLAAELAPKVRVNAVAPSLTRTPLAAGLIANDTVAAAVADLHALRRLGEPEDAAAAAAFLLSPESAWITGQVLGVDGGRATLRTKG
ncbi:MAG TPA: SDR family oxidoreductase [Alphaproteobacteria bacterium]|nr:SDR family oxidoreductase [Alphaproteobacteria bacterium]